MLGSLSKTRRAPMYYEEFQVPSDSVDPTCSGSVGLGTRTPNPPGVARPPLHFAADDLLPSNVSTPTFISDAARVLPEDLCGKLVELKALQERDDLRSCATLCGTATFMAALGAGNMDTVLALETTRTRARAESPESTPVHLDLEMNRQWRPEGIPKVTFAMWPCDLAALWQPPALPEAQEAIAAACSSLGSIGHPLSCAAPCKYVKRKGGCKDGAQCSLCHQCFWQRGVLPKDSVDTQVVLADESPRPNTTSAAAAVGSNGHPVSCGPPCKYFRRKGGCRDGADCPNCHQCHWQRVLPPATLGGTSQPDEGLADPAPAASSSLDHSRKDDDDSCTQGLRWSVSVGSVGHPHSCKLACKYFSKRNGCKDGLLCNRCHLCRWSRYMEMAAQPTKLAVEDRVSLFL